MRTISSHSEAVSEIALEIARLDYRLAEIAATIALPPDFAQMNEDRIPKDTAANLWGTIHWVRTDLLSAAIGSGQAIWGDEADSTEPRSGR